MDILGIGVPEIIFVILIAFIVLGPKDMQNTGKTIGKWLRSIITSDGWKIFQQTSRELRTLPNKLIRDANDELRQINQDINPASNFSPKRVNPSKPNIQSQPYSTKPAPQQETENKIAPTESEIKENESDQPDNA